jgi:hypothetical protein
MDDPKDGQAQVMFHASSPLPYWSDRACLPPGHHYTEKEPGVNVGASSVLHPRPSKPDFPKQII